MPPKTRVDIIVGKLKPTADKPSMKMERMPDKMHSSDFVQEIDMDEDKMAYESAGEALLHAIKQSDAAGVAQAICDIFEIHSTHESSESPEEELDEHSEEY